MAKWINRDTNEVGTFGTVKRGNKSNGSNQNLRILAKTKDVLPIPFLLMITFPKELNINYSPGIKTSWRRRNYVSLYVPVTSQVRLNNVLLERHNDVSKGRNNDAPSLRLHEVWNKFQMKHPATSRWNVVKTPQWCFSTASYWNAITTSQKDVTTTPHHYVSSTSQTSLKWTTQQRLSGALPRRLSGTYPRRPISTSLRRLL